MKGTLMGIRYKIVLGMIVVAAHVPGLFAAWFTPTGKMALPRWNHTATLLLSGKVLVAGGETNNSLPFVTPSASAELYDPDTGTWTMTGSMTTARQNHTATLLSNGKVLIAGGTGDTAPTLLSSAEIYDPDTQTWEATGDMTEGRHAHTATVLSDGRVLVVGGYGIDGDYFNSLFTAELFDPATGMWTATGSLHTRRAHHAATFLPSGKVLVACGYNWNDPISTAELYNPVDGEWTVAAPLLTAPEVGTATLLPNGEVLVARGLYFNGTAWEMFSQLYDPTRNAWRATSRTSGFTSYHTADLLTDGRVLISGGYLKAGTFDKTGQIYLPEYDVWIYTDYSLIWSRDHHTSTRLLNGNVLITGGLSRYFGLLSQAEIYTSTNPPIAPLTAGNCMKLPDGAFRFSFTNRIGGAFRVFASTNTALPWDGWIYAGAPVEMPPATFQFTDWCATNFGQRFYRVVAP